MEWLDFDLNLIICSYLSFEDILIKYNNNLNTRNKIIKILYKKLPEIDIASYDGYLHTVMYLFENGVVPTSDAIDYASENGHLNIVKYLYEKGIRPTIYAINCATKNGHLKVVIYLVEKGMVPSNYTIDIASYDGYLHTVMYLVEKGWCLLSTQFFMLERAGT